jgi:hypothetical protein
MTGDQLLESRWCTAQIDGAGSYPRIERTLTAAHQEWITEEPANSPAARRRIPPWFLSLLSSILGNWVWHRSERRKGFGSPGLYGQVRTCGWCAAGISGARQWRHGRGFGGNHDRADRSTTRVPGGYDEVIMISRVGVYCWWGHAMLWGSPRTSSMVGTLLRRTTTGCDWGWHGWPTSQWEDSSTRAASGWCVGPIFSETNPRGPPSSDARTVGEAGLRDFYGNLGRIRITTQTEFASSFLFPSFILYFIFIPDLNPKFYGKFALNFECIIWVIPLWNKFIYLQIYLVFYSVSLSILFSPFKSNSNSNSHFELQISKYQS